MNNHRGEFGSPHMSIPMKGDITKIDPLMDMHTAAVRSSNIHREEENREMGITPAGNSRTEFVATVNGNYDVGYQPSQRMPHMCPAPNVESHGLPQARQNDIIFREPHAPTSWSNIVSSNAPSSPDGLATRSSSGETLLASNMNMSQPAPTNFHYLGARSRSHSFDTESAPRYLPKSLSFGNAADSNQQIGPGIPPSHPGHSSYKDSTMHINMMHPSTPYQDFRPSMESYSPASLGDSMTDQTSPMSSPSLSPHVSPGMIPRKHHGDGPPPMWQLSDTNEYHSEPSSPHHRSHSHLPQSIPEHQRHEPADPAAHHGHHSYSMTPHHNGHMSPPRQLYSPSAGNHHHHQSMYHRRPGSNPHTSPSSSHTPLHHRSPTEVLKTLLRKKACLYEPETSFAVSLVTWLVGRRLALSQGYFTRQQLQSGVHSCVSGKIEEGHVTRTKVNRCMQVILNSCFHYIIPRPDGSEECGKAFRAVFSREAADEEHLLETLPAPWNNLNLPSMTEENTHSSLFHDTGDDGDHPPGKPPSKESSSTSQAGDSLDSGCKRSVLLCFNENIRSAADVFRCHNEFIRDVAHTGNLSLSPEDWQSFFSGSRTYRNRGTTASSFQSRYFHLVNIHDHMDEQGLSKLRTSWCAKRYDHDHSFCAFAHVDINRGWLRRDPFIYNYKPIMCPYIKPLQYAEDCYVNMCMFGVKCNHSHSKEEIQYHPETYKRQSCRNALGSCPLGDICPNTHAEVSSHQSHGYNRQGKRHYHDHSSFHRATHPGSKRRGSFSTGHAAGFGKLPDGSPMLYIDPAPLSEFEKTLLLPGLQAIFRDHSSSIFYSAMSKSSPYEYGSFGYRNTEQMGTTCASSKLIGRH
eukprot:CAMPEP_0172297732 /NCGR_PEP_ID=MMETSP1058-20130122/647_1 /TAXON_ID=83371 /ORGANISM="Detonula confervacea, Strain CCMP 353" /LENGTH=855 /DNA_ID=CAMNT_0013006917 /DNA_START=472 /DNA_END=3039 /DNA_ORIENTATION=+